MDDVVFWTIALICCEIFEGAWQRSSSLFEALGKSYMFYQKSVFLFFAMHPSFYLMLLIVLAVGNLNLLMVLIIALKIFDLFMKIELIRQIFIKRLVPEALAQMLSRQIPKSTFFIGLVVYPPFLYIALSIG
ncbi:MAG TPA: hypothetical protein ENN12_02305 [Epsilonproteobacteria bacterium]|nr:hypothetical protein [Campylobacterota bacterium]